MKCHNLDNDIDASNVNVSYRHNIPKIPAIFCPHVHHVNVMDFFLNITSFLALNKLKLGRGTQVDRNTVLESEPSKYKAFQNISTPKTIGNQKNLH